MFWLVQLVIVIRVAVNRLESLLEEPLGDADLLVLNTVKILLK